MYSSGLSLKSTVNEIMDTGQVVWPQILLYKYPLLSSVNGPKSKSICDQIDWHDSSGVSKCVSVREIWKSIRLTSPKVDWYNVVWFSNCIPRHAFNLWLIIKRRLKTQDLLKQWDISNNLSHVCSLCDKCPDSHEHLFFDCSFASQVWNRVKDLAGLPNVKASMEAILCAINPFAARKSSRSVVSKLVVAATAYFIWQERNNRLFSQQKRPVDQVVECILNTIRFKLFSCRFKRSTASADIARIWNIPCSVFI